MARFKARGAVPLRWRAPIMQSARRLLGMTVLLFALFGTNASGDPKTASGDILAGWTRAWEWHATPGGKIWRGDGNGPFLDSYAEWGWLRRLEDHRENAGEGRWGNGVPGSVACDLADGAQISDVG